MNEEFLKNRLCIRAEQGLLRTLSLPNNLVDFASNDYLGFARSEELQEILSGELRSLHPQPGIGSTGSRLLTGNSLYAEETEKSVAEFYQAEAGLIFNSGYDANVGLISSVAQRGDLVFYDELSHASIYDGIRLSKAGSFPFRHNDVLHLEERLKYFRSNNHAAPACFVVVESVYSMDGDLSPLKEISALCEEYGANLIVDEAHATGIFGAKGQGRVLESGLQEKIFARMHTFGKALGCHGAVVLGSGSLRDYLVNFSRSFIYTTAAPVHTFAAIRSAHRLLINSNDKILNINKLIKLFKFKINDMGLPGFLESNSPIQSFLFEGNEAVKQLSLQVQKDGFDVRPILSPTVPKGKERIRICLHAFNTEEQINGLLSSFHKHIVSIRKKQTEPVNL